MVIQVQEKICDCKINLGYINPNAVLPACIKKEGKLAICIPTYCRPEIIQELYCLQDNKLMIKR